MRDPTRRSSNYAIKIGRKHVTLRAHAQLDEDGRACVTEAAKAAQRGAVLTHQLLAFSRKQPLAPSLLDPAEVVASMGAQLSRTLGGRMRVECVVGDDPWPVRADAEQLDNCLYNLAINARDAMRLGGVLKLVAVNRPQSLGAPDGLPARDCVEFSVIDEGTDMTPEVLARAQEPFFTTKPVGEGTGLGLSMVDGFARQSSGGMKIESVPGQETTVSIWLPRASGVVGKQVPVAGITTGRGTVLLVDDKTSVRQTLSLLLKRAGFSVVAADSGETAMDLLEGSTVFELLVTDQSMPGLWGAELIAEAARLRPGMPTMLITGYDRVQGLERLDGRVTILRKPFGRGPFIGQVRALMDSSSNVLIEEDAKGIAKPGAIIVPIKPSRF